MTEEATLLASILIASSISTFLFFAHIVSPRRNFRERYERFRLRRDQNEIRFVWSLFVGSIVFVLLFIHLYGGLWYVLNNISSIRSGTSENKTYLGSFFYLFFSWAFVSLAYFWIDRLRGGRESFLALVLLVAVTLMYLFLNGGRIFALQAILILIFGVWVVGGKVKLWAWALVVSLGLFILLYGKPVIYNIARNDLDIIEIFVSIDSSVLVILAMEFSHQFLSLVNSIESYDLQFRFFSDYWYWSVKWLKLLGMDAPDSISYYNTYLVRGVWDSEIPPGLVAFGYQSAGIIGVFVHAAVLGVIVGLAERFLCWLKPSNMVAAFYVVACVSMPYLVWNSDPALFVQINMTTMLAFGLWATARGCGLIRAPRGVYTRGQPPT